MKLSRMVCDFCGAEIGNNQRYGTLTAPDFTKAAPTSSQAPAMSLAEMMGLLGGGIGQSTSKEYHVCEGCVRGLLKAREWLKAEAIKQMNEQPCSE